jgi:hypothetical protein
VSNGKGDNYRPVNGPKYREEHDRIFARPPVVRCACGATMSLMSWGATRRYSCWSCGRTEERTP